MRFRPIASAPLFAIAVAAAIAPAPAQDTYPSRSVKLVVPQNPGGGVDLVARLMADKLRVAAMGQSFVVENIAGAGGAIATQTASTKAFTDAMGGQIQVIFPGVAAAMPHIRSGAFKPLAVTGQRRQSVLPNVPTFKALGYEGFNGLTWYAIVGPSKLPDTITVKLNADINRILVKPELHDAFTAQGLEVMPMTPAQFGKYIADEIAHWTAVARASKIEE